MRIIQERDGNSNPTVSYTRGTDLSASLEGAGGIGGLLARSHGYSSGNWSTHNFYHADGNGNITYIVNSSQALAASYRYDPFGNTISSSGTLASANVYRFSSKEIHANSGMYYYLYRFYDPNLQRWINRDPVGEGGFETARRGWQSTAGGEPNLFLFVGNTPLNRIDSFGLLGLHPCSCNDPCGDAKKTGLDGGDIAGVVCCNMKKYSCIWVSGGGGDTSNPTGTKIVDKCILAH